jgi:hypothetical protein
MSGGTEAAEGGPANNPGHAKRSKAKMNRRTPNGSIFPGISVLALVCRYCTRNSLRLCQLLEFSDPELPLVAEAMGTTRPKLFLGDWCTCETERAKIMDLQSLEE